MTRAPRRVRRAAWWIAMPAAGAALAAGLAGCGSVGYLAQSVSGHLGVILAARPVDAWLADPATPPALRGRLERSQRIRDYAVAELREPDNASYRRYADLGRPAAVWNVVAAPELSLRLETWCFPVVGCVGYRGYFDRAAADAEAERLRARGLEVAVYGVPAYSTLGKLPGAWFADPLLNTFIDDPVGDLAALIFHELAHQIAYAPGDTTFNESFATAVERIGTARWLAAHATEDERAAYARRAALREDFLALTRRYRQRFEALYGGPGDETAKRRGKAALREELLLDHRALKATPRWNGYTGYDRWFERANNASFGVLSAYHQDVPAFESLLARERGDLAAFYVEVRRLAALPIEVRRREWPPAAAGSAASAAAGLTPSTPRSAEPSGPAGAAR